MYRKIENDKLRKMNDKLIYMRYDEKFIISHSSFIISEVLRNLRKLERLDNRL
jgi:hypothetical protein